MKSCTRIGFYLLVLGLASFWSGCANQSSATANPGSAARDFEIVETATKRELTAKEMKQLRTMVAEYLAKEGVQDGGDYYVKIYLASEKPGGAEEWVVVRFTQPAGYTATRFSLLSSYPSYYDGYSSYYAYDYYPFSSFGFSRFSMQYCDDPFGYYGYNTYVPRRAYTGYFGHERDKDGRRDKDHKPDNRPHQPGPVVSGTSPGAPSPYRDPQRETRTNRWDDHRSGSNETPNHNDRRLTNRYDATQPWYARTATPADYTPAYVAPASGTPTNRPVRVTPNNSDAGVNRYERPRRDNADSSNRDSTYRNRDSGPNRATATSATQTQNTNRSAQVPTYTPAPPRSDPPARPDPPARYQAPQNYTPPSSQNDSSSRSDSTSRPSSRRDIHADDRSDN